MTTAAFRKLHEGPSVLLLPNAWDAGSARLVESLGAAAVATTSAGLCWSRGYADAAALPPEQIIAAAREIRRVVSVPLSVDMEAGYSDDPEAVADLALRLVDAGVNGVNIEDGTDAPELLCRKLKAIRGALASRGADLYLNVRTDVHLRGLVGPDDAVSEVVRRAGLYRAAGCDCLFTPGVSDAGQIGDIVAAIGDLPLNIMLVPDLPELPALQRLGVRRLSAGSAIAQAGWGHVGELATSFLAGDIASVANAPAAEYGAMNKLFAGITPQSGTH
jgi:2-methylisocitrate lyase-like PEP mutase family enzyme